VWQQDILRYSQEDVEHGQHGCGHVEGKDEIPLIFWDIKSWLWPCEIKGWFSFDVLMISEHGCGHVG